MVLQRVLLAVLVVTSLSRGATAQSTPSVQELVAAHDSSLQLIHAADIEVVLSHPDRSDVSEAEVRCHDYRKFRLRFSGVQQRLTERAMATPPPPRNFYTDSYSDGEVRWTLRDYDRERPRRITPLETAGVEGEISVDTVGQTASPTEFMLLLFRPGFGKPVAGLLLRHFVAAFKQAEVIGEELIEGHRCWMLRLRGPAPSLEVSDADDFVDLFLDPQVGFRVRQQNVHAARFNLVNPSGNGITVGTCDLFQRVDRFREHAPGVFLPEEGSAWVKSETRPKRLLTARFTFAVTAVNSPIDAAAFQFEFPEYLRVVDTRDGRDRPKLYIWDKGNQPGIQFSSTNDLMQFKHLDRMPSWKSWVGGVSAILVVIVFSVIMFWKYRKAR